MQFRSIISTQEDAAMPELRSNFLSIKWSSGRSLTSMLNLSSARLRNRSRFQSNPISNSGRRLFMEHQMQFVYCETRPGVGPGQPDFRRDTDSSRKYGNCGALDIRLRRNIISFAFNSSVGLAPDNKVRISHLYREPEGALWTAVTF